jgi:hypothetical protein
MSPILRIRLTPIGVVALACFVLTLLGGYVARERFPESSLGAFFGTWVGVLIGFIGSWMAYVAATVVLALAGHPCFVRDTTSHV